MGAGTRPARLALAAAMGAMAALSSWGAETQPRAETAWLLAGPFPIGHLSGLEEGLDLDFLASAGLAPAGEGTAAPLRVGRAGATSWREAAAGATADGVDFITALGPASNAVAYAYRDIYSPSPRLASLRIRSDDGVKVWVNGELALARHVYRSLGTEEDAVSVSLAAGKNRILVKVSQAEGEWGFALRLLSRQEDAAAAGAAAISALAACPDELSVPAGGALLGAVMSQPAYAIDGEARVELLGPAGELLASARAPASGRFKLQAPQGFAGRALLRARGLGGLAGLASPEAGVFVGDAAAAAREGAARARAAASTAAASAAGALDAPTLEFLARVIEGSSPPVLGGFDLALQALAEAEALARSPGARQAGLARYAHRSALDGSLQPYSLYLPRGYEGSRRYGLVVALHGAGGNDYAMAARLASAKPADLLILAPFGRGDLCYTSSGEEEVLEAIDLVSARYAIDPDRVYLVGNSMGGYGAWRLGQLHPRRFAAIAAFSGWASPDCLENLSSTPVLAVHGEEDTIVPIGSAARAAARLAELGAEVRFDRLPGVGHEAMAAWMGAKGPDRLLDWLRPRRRAAWPSSIALRTTMARTGSGSWASILGLATPLALAALDARIVDSRHVTVDSRNVSAFSLDLRHPSLAKGGRILILADGRNLTADAGSPAAVFELGPSGGFAALGPAAAGAAAASAAPPNGGSGFAALFDGPLRIVYGTRRRDRAADNEAVARAVAASGPASFEVLADSDLSPALEASASLLLVGWPDENSVLARLASRLPMAIKGRSASLPGEKAAGSGLILACPNPEAAGRLVGVLALPMRASAAVAFARSLVAPMAGYGPQAEPCGYWLPDAIVLDGAGRALWAGCFDWRWRSLAKLGSR